ncbi:right handed beta helix region family protein [Lysobacter antibioticus]|uniref:Right handed beta helix region family protein n=2 Tax=Lysobacter antibioticus TaxID=84531 RepID=A0A0S2FA37_LYSAN|nr:right-handed parallel beta-helix repeat-containing protein [Lysobacter antibioticus]ALN80363.1 right handed beta helix region family protein [Lysobacter antibioticus]
MSGIECDASGRAARPTTPPGSPACFITTCNPTQDTAAASGCAFLRGTTARFAIRRLIGALKRIFMRSFLFSSLALSAAMFSANAFACDTVVTSANPHIMAPGKYCLTRNLDVPIVITGGEIEFDCKGRTLANPDPNGGGPAAITVDSWSKVTVRNCRIEGYSFGIHLRTRSGDQLLNNTVVRPYDAGIVIIGDSPPDGEGARVVGNRVIDYGNPNISPWREAIQITMAPRTVVTNNVIAGYNGGGLLVDRSADVQATGNQFLDFPDNTDRIIELRDSPRARLVHNSIMLRTRSGVRGLIGGGSATCIENVAINTAPSGFSECAVTRYNVEEPSPFPPQPLR